MPSTPKRKSSKKLRKHIPGLLPDTLKIKLDELKALGLSKQASQTVEDILKAAANPDHGKADVIVKSLPQEQQKLIGKTAKAVKSISDDVMARGHKALRELSDDEWNRLVASDE